MTDLEATPVEGTRLGRYLFLREIAIGPLGPLYELRGEEEANGLSALGRIVHLSPELNADGEQAIVASAWEALELRHEHTLCVADVVFGKGWVTLVHDHAEGSLLRSLLQRAHERNSTFPVAVALRIVTDIIAGLQETRKLCESVGIAWTPGGTNSSSLYLCGDGRTRALDGQLAVTLLRQDHAYARSIEGLYSAPEVLSAEEQEQLFGAALRILPAKPAKFILYFETDGVRLTPESQALLPQILGTAKERKSQDISVVGHASKLGDEDFNITLSRNRAAYVSGLLVKAGIAKESVEITSHGSANPLVLSSNQNEPRNRRVEVTVR